VVRGVPALVLASAAAICLAPGALAAEATGKITGKVTSAASEAPIAGIEVCAFPKASAPSSSGGGEGEEEGGEEEGVKCPTTDANGEYTIQSLASGEYVVGFGAPFMSGLDYVTQFYDGKSSLAEAQPVTVTAGATRSGIDAKLAEGGRIAGQVTDASTGAGVKGATVCAFGSKPETGGCGLSGADGEYTITGLASGEYKVGFAGAQYAVQYYDDKAKLAEATPVSVTAGATVSGIDAALAPNPPNSPQGTIAPATTALPTTMPGHTREPSKSQGPRPRLALAATGVLPLRGSRLWVKVKCSGAACRGAVELTVQIMGVRMEDGGVLAAPEALILAKGPVSLAAGRSATIALHLTDAGRMRLVHPARQPLSGQLTISLIGAGATLQPVRAD
jgi:hypothetical protein